MRLSKTFALLLVALFLFGCGTVEREIVSDEVIYPSEQEKKMNSSSLTDREKEILDAGITERDKFPLVRPVFTDSPDWEIEFEDDEYTVTLNDGRGILNIKYVDPNTDNTRDWLDKRIFELASMGFYFGRAVSVENITIFADNRDSEIMLGEEFKNFFDPDVITIAGFFGNIDSIWEMSGYIKDESDYHHLMILADQSKQVPWER